MKNIFLIVLIIFSFQVSAQTKKEIKQKGITLIKSYEQDIDQGEKDLLLEKEEYFNKNGELLEIKKFTEKGTIKSWEKFVYNDEGLLIESLTLNYRGDIEERIEYKYKNGLEVQKLYYDSKNRMYKKKQYEYQFN